MKHNGLVSLALIALSNLTLAQDVVDPRFEIPPSPRPQNTQVIEPPRPLVTAEFDAALTIEAELQRFRNDLREFQSLREEVARELKMTESEGERTALQQRRELLDLLTKFAKNGVARKSTPLPSPLPVLLPAAQPIFSDPPPPPSIPVATSAPEAAPTEPPLTVIPADVADPFALGKVLFRSGDFAGAEQAFRKVPLNAENELTLKYLTATCLRRRAQWKSAIELYKVVAESKQDPVLRELANWQLVNIRWYLESESQLDQLRQQRAKNLSTQEMQSAATGERGTLIP